MEHPVREISSVIRLLTQSPPSTQQATIETYFTPNASFTHPFCRTGTFNGSRTVIAYIYRWYKILSPHIDIQIDSIAFDQHNLLLYVSMHQTFSIQFLPFHRATVAITTVLQLTKSQHSFNGVAPSTEEERKHTQHITEGRARTKYYIQSQQDLYQTSEFVKFVVPWFGIGTISVIVWQFVATFFCVVGAVVGWPVSWLEENVWGGNKDRSITDNRVVGIERYDT